MQQVYLLIFFQFPQGKHTNYTHTRSSSASSAIWIAALLDTTPTYNNHPISNNIDTKNIDGRRRRRRRCRNTHHVLFLIDKPHSTWPVFNQQKAEKKEHFTLREKKCKIICFELLIDKGISISNKQPSVTNISPYSFYSISKPYVLDKSQ